MLNKGLNLNFAFILVVLYTFCQLWAADQTSFMPTKMAVTVKVLVAKLDDLT